MTAAGLVQKSHNSYKTALGEAVTTGLQAENPSEAIPAGAFLLPGPDFLSRAERVIPIPRDRDVL